MAWVRRAGLETFQFDHVWTFAIPTDELWHVLERTDDFPKWWSWLREFDAGTQPAELRAGAHAKCLIQGPVPYALRLDVEVERAEPPHIVETYVRGDLDGPARLELAATGNDTHVHLSWELELRDRMLRRLARVARPMMLWAHDRVVMTGVDQFRRRALADG